MVAGISIGAMNAALIAGNHPEKRVREITRVLGGQHATPGHAVSQFDGTMASIASSIKPVRWESLCSAQRISHARVA
jgi:predicted acylesterase/phospholipase RssA